MKFTPIFGLVLGIHALVITLLILQPGCQSTPKPVSDAPGTVVAPPGAPPAGTPPGGATAPGGLPTPQRPANAAPLTEPATLDQAFNAGFTPAGGGTTAGTRATPTRPNRMEMPGTEAETLGETLPVENTQPQFITYTVKAGDSPWKIAKANKVTLDELLAANGLTRQSVLKIGQTLQIPSSSTTLMPAPVQESSLPGTSADVESEAYTVVAGDTLSGLARKFGTSSAALRSANGLSNDTIRVGQVLLIPKPGVSGAGGGTAPVAPRASAPAPAAGQEVHTVQPGETPSAIAARYGMKTADLIRLNGNFDPRRLQVGQKLVVKAGTGGTPGAGTASPAARPAVVPPMSTVPAPSTVPAAGTVSPPAGAAAGPAPERATTPPAAEPEFNLDDLEEIPVVPVEPSANP